MPLKLALVIKIFAGLELAKREAHNYSVVIALTPVVRVMVPVKQPSERLAYPGSNEDELMRAYNPFTL